MRGSEAVEAKIAKTRRGSAAVAQDMAMQRAIGQYLESALGQTLRDFSLVREKLEILNADRGTPDRYAVRRGDVTGSMELEDLVSVEVSTVTAADFNALVQDVHSIHAALVALVTTVARTGK